MTTQPKASELDATDGHLVIRLDQQRIATFQRLYRGAVLSENEVRLRYRVRNGDVKLATNAFFFQEGHAKYYEPARFGQFRVDKEGELLLVDMFDKDLNRLGVWGSSITH